MHVCSDRAESSVVCTPNFMVCMRRDNKALMQSTLGKYATSAFSPWQFTFSAGSKNRRNAMVHVLAAGFATRACVACVGYLRLGYACHAMLTVEVLIYPSTQDGFLAAAIALSVPRKELFVWPSIQHAAEANTSAHAPCARFEGGFQDVSKKGLSCSCIKSPNDASVIANCPSLFPSAFNACEGASLPALQFISRDKTGTHTLFFLRFCCQCWAVPRFHSIPS